MIVESLAIIAVILVFSMMVSRSGRRGTAFLSLPLISVPVFHLIGWAWPPFGHLVILLDLIGMTVGLILCAVLSRAFRSRRARYVYAIVCGVFVVALTAAYLINT